MAIVAMAAMSACGDDNKEQPTPQPGEGGKFEGIVFATSIPNADGSSGAAYLQGIPKLTANTIDNSKGRPTGFGTTPIVAPSGNVYSLPDYMGNSRSAIVRYVPNANGELVEKGKLELTAGAQACNVVEVNAEKAYVSCQGTGKIVVFNPTTMKQVKEIDLNAYAQAGMNVAPSAMIVRDADLFVGLSQRDAKWMPTKASAELVVIDTKTDAVKKHIVNTTLGLSTATRPIDPKSIFMDENKDIYVNCIGSFGMNPEFPGGIIRIKNGTMEIDPDYSFKFSEVKVSGLVGDYGKFLGTVCYMAGGKLYAYINAPQLDPDSKNPYLTIAYCPVEVDLYNKTITKIEGLGYSNPHACAVAKYGNKVVYGLSNKTEHGFFSYDPATKKVEGPILKVTGNPLFFYSYGAK
jgi:lipoprotein